MRGPTVGDLGELELVERIVRHLGDGLDANIRIGPGDDAAVIAAGGAEIVICTDSQHEDVHFRHDWIDPRSLGRKAIAVNASDIGAMGAAPRSFVVALGLPAETAVEWVEALVDGMRAGAAEYGAAVVGGDVACIPGKISINVTATGALAPGVAPVCRSGAESTDQFCVTGFPGRAAAGRCLLEAGFGLDSSAGLVEPASWSGVGLEVDDAVACLLAFARPRPPVRFGCTLALLGIAHAMIDISDGVALDLRRLCTASGMGLDLDAEALGSDPVLQSLAQAGFGDVEEWVLEGGEDYELAIAVNDAGAARALELAGPAGLEFRQFGVFAPVDRGLNIVRNGAHEPLAVVGWDHFSG